MARRVIKATLIGAALVALSGCPHVALRDHIERLDRFSEVIYVSQAEGSDGNAGKTRSSALATIRAGIDAAAGYIDDGFAEAVEVRVAKGIYEIDTASGETIFMEDKVSLYGGYSLDFRERDPELFPTEVVDLGETGDSLAVIRADKGASLATTVDGFTIHAGDTDMVESSTIGISVVEAGLTITNNTIYGGYAPGSSSSFAVIVINESSSVIENNVIYGGTAAGGNYGIIVHENSSAEIRDNTITGGMPGSNMANGLLISGSDATITGNVIDGGEGQELYGIRINTDSNVAVSENSISGGTAAGKTTGVYVHSEQVKIAQNRIYGGSSGTAATGIHVHARTWVSIIHNAIHGGAVEETVDGDAVGILVGSSDGLIANNTVSGGESELGSSIAIALGEGSSPRIVNNALLTFGAPHEYCLMERSDNDESPNEVLNNNFYDMSGSTVLYRPWNGGDLTTLAEIEAYDHVSGSWSDDPRFVDIDGADDDPLTMLDNDWHLTAATPVEVRQGGRDGGAEGWGSGVDLEGTVRTNLTNGPDGGPTNEDAAGWSMGAYEQD